MRKSHLRLAAVFAALALFVAVPVTASAKPTITISGSTSVAPLAAQLARKYVKLYKKRASFKLLQGGSDIGIADVSKGRVTIGMSSRDPKPSDPGGIVFNKIAHDSICLISNNGNKIGNLSQEQVQAIFAGDVRNWNQVDGAKASGTINLYVRTAASGTQDAFDKIFMAGKKTFSGASAKASNGLIQQSVKSDPNGIGYVSLAFTAGTNANAYKGVACTLRNSKSGQYGGLRSFYMVTRGAAVGAAKKWINWIKNSKVGRQITATEWVPLS